VNAPAKKPLVGEPVVLAGEIRADPVKVFIARAEARALLWAAGEFDLHEAVDKLQADAERDGLVVAIGQDEVQAIINKALALARLWSDDNA
jgi:hypothetical protein